MNKPAIHPTKLKISWNSCLKNIKKMNSDKTLNNCRNCKERFSCELAEENICCEYHVVDEEAATCDDCKKRFNCVNYLQSKPTCVDWEPEVFCDDCEKNTSCKNYMPGGRICKKFKEIRYKLTEKGCLYIAIVETIEKNSVGLLADEILEKGFFEELEHEMRIYGYIPRTKVGLWVLRTKIFFSRLLHLNFLKTKLEIFMDIAKDKKYFAYFGSSEENVKNVYERFTEMLENQNK